MSTPNLIVCRPRVYETVSAYWNVFCVRPWGMMSDSPKLSNPLTIICGPCGNGELIGKIGLDPPKPNRKLLTRFAETGGGYLRVRSLGEAVLDAPNPTRLLLMKVRPGLIATEGLWPYFTNRESFPPRSS